MTLGRQRSQARNVAARRLARMLGLEGGGRRYG